MAPNPSTTRKLTDSEKVVLTRAITLAIRDAWFLLHGYDATGYSSENDPGVVHATGIVSDDGLLSGVPFRVVIESPK